MKSNFVFSSSSLFIGLFLFFFTENVCSQESADNWTLKQARQWTQKQEWANGLKAMPHKTTDYQEFASQYHKNKKVWDKTFQWLATHDLVNMPAGRYEPDVTFYKAKKIKYVDSTPDTFFMFFPKNFHQALVKAGKEPEDIRVIVAKIEYIP